MPLVYGPCVDVVELQEGVPCREGHVVVGHRRHTLVHYLLYGLGVMACVEVACQHNGVWLLLQQVAQIVGLYVAGLYGYNVEMCGSESQGVGSYLAVDNQCHTRLGVLRVGQRHLLDVDVGKPGKHTDALVAATIVDGLAVDAKHTGIVCQG